MVHISRILHNFYSTCYNKLFTCKKLLRKKGSKFLVFRRLTFWPLPIFVERCPIHKLALPAKFQYLYFKFLCSFLAFLKVPQSLWWHKIAVKKLGNNSKLEVYMWPFLMSLEKALDVLYELKIWQESVIKQLRYSLLKLRVGE